jgi:hypothetical protein
MLNGTRSSSATSYLAPRYVSRLDVVLHVRVLRVISEKHNLSLRTVEVTQDGGSACHLVAMCIYDTHSAQPQSIGYARRKRSSCRPELLDHLKSCCILELAIPTRSQSWESRLSDIFLTLATSSKITHFSIFATS